MSRMNEPMRPPTLSSTRQMLDELDALMARMLTLPVSDVEDELQLPASASRQYASPEPESASLWPPEEEAAPATIPLYRTEAEPELPHQVAPQPQPVSWKLEPPPPLDEIAPPASDRAPLPELGEYPHPPVSLRRLFMWPLWLINGIFDGFTWLLGPLGKWLRGPGGRGLLGFSGVLLLVLASAWLVSDWMGWTSWTGWSWKLFGLE